MLNKVPTAHILEKDFQRDVRNIAVEYGWEVFTTLRSKGSPAGETDLRLVRPPRYLTVELKKDGENLTRKQAAVAKLLRACPGIEYHLWRPEDIDLVHQYLRPDDAI